MKKGRDNQIPEASSLPFAKMLHRLRTAMPSMWSEATIGSDRCRTSDVSGRMLCWMKPSFVGQQALSLWNLFVSFGAIRTLEESGGNWEGLPLTGASEWGRKESVSVESQTK